MPSLPFVRRPLARVVALLTLVAAVALGACSESLDSGAGCPALCPLTNAGLRDTVLDAVAVDPTVAGFPPVGDPVPLLVSVAPGPDSLDVRAVLRFDSLPAKFAPPAGGDSVAISTLDSSFLRIRLDTTGTRLPQAATLEAYDVDTVTVNDTTAAALVPLFRPDRRLGTLAFTANQVLGDSIRIPIDNAALAAKARNGARLRVGLRIVSSGIAQLRVIGIRAASITETGPVLTFDPASDTLYRPISVSQASSTPATNRAAAVAAVEQLVVARTPRTPSGTDIIVSGVPGRRTLLRFNVPADLADSTEIVRAVLEIVQRPARFVSRTDTVRLRTDAVLATTAVTDLARVFELTTTAFSLDTLNASPADSGLRSLSIVSLVRSWRGLPANTQRAIVLRGLFENAEPGELRFFSTEGPAGLRPRLRLSYVPKTSFGLP